MLWGFEDCQGGFGGRYGFVRGLVGLGFVFGGNFENGGVGCLSRVQRVGGRR